MKRKFFNMAAPTTDGRAAVIDMAEALMPLLDGQCLAWADVYNTRRYMSIANAGEYDSGRAYSSAPGTTSTGPGRGC
jgi:hypothetical protein